MITTRTIHVRNSFAPEVTFEVLFSKWDLKTRDTVFDRVLSYWTDITGLNWKAMVREDQSNQLGNEKYNVVVVTSPITNRSATTFFWDRIDTTTP